MAVEVKRNRKKLLFTISLGILAIPVLWLLGELDRTTLMYVAIGVSALVPLETQTHLARDQLEGGLEFFATLPVSGTVYACARWCIAAIVTFPLAVVGGSFVVKILSAFGLGGIESRMSFMFPLAWLLASGYVIGMAGMVTRFRIEQFVRVLVMLCFLPLVVGWIIEILVSDPVELFFRFLRSDPYLVVQLVYTAVATIAAAMTVVGFWWAKQGFDRFRPRPDLV